MIILLSVGVLSWGSFILYTSFSRAKAIDLGLSVGDMVVSMFKGNLNIDNSIVDDNVKLILDGYMSDLKLRNNAILNVSDIYDREYSDFNTVPNITSPDDSYTAEEIEQFISEGLMSPDYNNGDSIDVPILPDDVNIYTEGEEEYIKIMDIKVDDFGDAYIDYKGITMHISGTKLPITYDKLIQSRDYRFLLKDYSAIKDGIGYNIDMGYVSLNKKNTLNVIATVMQGKIFNLKIDLKEE